MSSTEWTCEKLGCDIDIRSVFDSGYSVACTCYCEVDGEMTETCSALYDSGIVIVVLLW